MPWHTKRRAGDAVLVTEDDEILATAVAAGLRREGMAVGITLDGAAALERLAVNRYDVVVLDRDLPCVPGDDVCRALAAGGSGTRVLMLTAARSVRERVEGLDLGADDYLPKPFDFAELVARIRALGRMRALGRRAAAPLPVTLTRGDLSPDPARRVAVRAGRRLPLTTKELAVLECLLAADGRTAGPGRGTAPRIGRPRHQRNPHLPRADCSFTAALHPEGRSPWALGPTVPDKVAHTTFGALKQPGQRRGPDPPCPHRMSRSAQSTRQVE